jgi:hypothetical protein
MQNTLSASTTFAERAGQAALAFYNTTLVPFEVIAVAVAAVLITATVILIIKTGWFALRVNRVRDVILKTDMPKRQAVSAWDAVQKHFFAGGTNDLKVAVMDADNILNDALQYAGVRGINLGDRLKHIKRNQVPNLEDIWEAHKLRNEIAHETSFPLKRDAAERALEAYRIALKNLGIFDQ